MSFAILDDRALLAKWVDLGEDILEMSTSPWNCNAYLELVYRRRFVSGSGDLLEVVDTTVNRGLFVSPHRDMYDDGDNLQV